ncbi:MAG: acyl-CoA-binding protein [Gammaproteobacteria bacterium]
MTQELSARFEAASQAAKQLPSRPANDDMLELYALYKQGSAGDCTGSRPGILDFVGGAKFDAWSALSGTSEEEAKLRYIAKVEALQRG